MNLKTPVYGLKREAKQLARTESMPLNQALDHIARREGFASWSLLAARHAEQSPAQRVYAGLRPGSLLLIGARPGQGKTLFGLELVACALKDSLHAAVFSFEFTADGCERALQSVGLEVARHRERFSFVGDDSICASSIIARLAQAPAGTVVLIDYLQLLDQRRENPPLADQVVALNSFAKRQGVILAFISQISRSFEPTDSQVPGLADVRLPNPLDLSLFDQTCFMNEGNVKVSPVRAIR